MAWLLQGAESDHVACSAVASPSDGWAPWRASPTSSRKLERGENQRRRPLHAKGLGRSDSRPNGLRAARHDEGCVVDVWCEAEAAAVSESGIMQTLEPVCVSGVVNGFQEALPARHVAVRVPRRPPHRA